jgi:hypothetical protein
VWLNFRLLVGLLAHSISFLPFCFLKFLIYVLVLNISVVLRWEIRLGTRLFGVKVDMGTVHVHRRFRHCCLAQSGLTLPQLVTLGFGDQLDRVLGVIIAGVLARTAGFSRRALGGALLILGLLLVHYKNAVGETNLRRNLI